MEDLILLPLLILVFGYITITLIFQPHLKPKKEQQKTKTEDTEKTEIKKPPKQKHPKTQEPGIKKFIIIALAVAAGIILANVIRWLFNLYLIGSFIKAFS